MTKISRNRHKHKHELLDRFGITEATDRLKELIEDHDKAVDRILNPLKK